MTDWGQHPVLIDKTPAERREFILGNFEFWKALLRAHDKPGNATAGLDEKLVCLLLADIDIAELLIREQGQQ